MKSINHKWTTVTNPSGLLLTNTFVNYYEGMTVLQTGGSPIHVLPNSYVGKKFHINNQSASTNDVIVQVNVQGGPQIFNIDPGDSAIFVYTGNGIWDQTGGEDVIRQIIGTITGSDLAVRRIINFNTPPDTGLATYNIGTVPPGFSVTSIVVEIPTAFNDPIVDTMLIETALGPINLMPAISIDIKRVGIYIEQHLTLTTPISGLIRAVFNTGPAANGGTLGIAGITVNYLAT